MPKQAGVIVVTSLALESFIARGPGISVLCSHASQLNGVLGAAVEQGASGIISFGIAGGLAPDLAAGDWIIASGVRSGKELIATDRIWTQRLSGLLPGAVRAHVAGVDALVLSPSEKFRLHHETGAVAVDMESHIAAKVAAAHGIPFVAFRVIVDAAHRTLPPAAAVGLRPDGTPDILAVIQSVLRKPSQLADLVRVALDARVAELALRAGRKQLGAAFGFPYYTGSPLLPGLPDCALDYGATR
ncbi:MAG TPA: phosphorylase [Pseudolabrys sp.]|nr:phosphorylase [Pseudolabrys sp.]